MNSESVRELLAVSEFLRLTSRFRGIGGWLSNIEGYLLYRLARDGDGAGAIVEIGSWMGRSTAWLAAGSMAGGREPVHAVDTFKGSPEHQGSPVLRDEGTTYHRFAENLERVGVLDHVEPVIADSRAAAARWQRGPIRLLFIDGDHSYEAVKADLECWLPHVAIGGYVVFDDVIDKWPGVQRAFAEATADAGPLKRLIDIGKVRVTRRRSAQGAG